MVLMLFKFGLPALLGYILFVGISGKFRPFRKPEALSERPAWFLGLWTGLAVALVFAIGLSTAYSVSLSEVRELFLPSAILLAGVLVPGFVAYFAYRSNVRQSLNRQEQSRLSQALDDNADAADFNTVQLAGSHTEIPLGEAFGESEDRFSYVSEGEEVEAIELSGDAAEPGIHASGQTDTVVAFGPARHNNGVNILAEGATGCSTSSASIVSLEEHKNDTAHLRVDRLESAESGVFHNGTPQESSLVSAGHSAGDEAERLDELNAEVAALRQTLTEEMNLREQTEEHLRVTRKALSALETESRSYEASKADALIGLEEDLELRIRETAAAEARAAREAAERESLEQKLVDLKQELLETKRGVRRSTAARAKALGTANKAVAFSRKTLESRARLEEVLENRQATISSLIKALEKEKRRTQDEVTNMAKQLVLNEKQLQARRSLEQLSRSAEGKMSNRLVKKIAKARPVVGED